MSALAKPETKYAVTSDGAAIAYQVFGDGPDLLFAVGAPSQADLNWTMPDWARFYRRLGAFARVIMFDERGAGLSDPLPSGDVPAEAQADAIAAVLDAAGSAASFLYVCNNAGPAGMAFAAHSPGRVKGIVFENAFARRRWAPDYRVGLTEAEWTARADGAQAVWGSGVALGMVFPDAEVDDALRDDWAQIERAAASPARLRRLQEVWGAADGRMYAGDIHVPVTVISAQGSLMGSRDDAQWLVDNIVNARMVEVGPIDTLAGPGLETVAELVAELVTGSARAAHVERRLAAVLFVDIVGSSDRLVSVGDSHWGSLLNRFRVGTAREIDEAGGTWVNTRGDDVLATFPLASTAVAAAIAIIKESKHIALDVRGGVHLGEIEVVEGDVLGATVHVGARVSGFAGAGEVVISQAVKDALLGAPVATRSLGARRLKGLPGDWPLYAVTTD
jgi:class 3 adenylate cyclase